jgi:hypothetical protein
VQHSSIGLIAKDLFVGASKDNKNGNSTNKFLFFISHTPFMADEEIDFELDIDYIKFMMESSFG